VSSTFTLKQVRYFLAVAEAGSLSAAAEVLFVSQPALSSAITELETGLEVQLCVRQKSRGVTLTPSGQAFYMRARELVREADELAWSTKSRGERLRGPLTFGCYTSLAAEVLPHYLTEFPRRQPDITLDYREGGNDELGRMLLMGEVDTAIVYDFGLTSGLRRAKLFEKAPHVLLPSGHPLAGREVVSLRDLEDEPFIEMTTSPAKSHTDAVFAAAGVTPNLRYHAGTADLAQQLVARGFGYAIMLSFPRRQGIFTELGLVRLRIEPQSPPVSVVVAWSPEVELNARARSFIDFVMASPLPDAPVID
jgi:DNA-binding transcriptional LysR family regulator